MKDGKVQIWQLSRSKTTLYLYLCICLRTVTRVGKTNDFYCAKSVYIYLCICGQ